MALAAENIIRSELPDWVYDSIEDTQTEVFWVTGGLGSGKSYGSAIWHLDRSLRVNWRSRFSWAIAPTHVKATDILIPTFQDVLEANYGMVIGSDYKITNGKPATLTFKRFPHKIYFHTANRPEWMVGTNISHYLGTEAFGYKKEVFEKCQARARDPHALAIQGMMEGTPEGLNDMAELANFDGYDEQNNFRRFILHTSDNPHLPDGYIEKLIRTYAYDPAKIESYVYGRFVAFTKGTAYWEFFESRNVVLDVQADPLLDLLMNWDFGTSPLPWVAMQRQPFQRRNGARRHRFVALAEGSGKARGLDDACAEFVVTFPPDKYYRTPIRIYGGHDGYFGSHLSPNCAYDQIQRFLKRHYADVQVCAGKSAPLVKDRLERVNQLFNYELFVVAAWCRNLIKSLAETTLKPGTWMLEKQKDKDMSHFSDTVGDALFNLTKNEDFAQPMKKRIYGINKTL